MEHLAGLSNRLVIYDDSPTLWDAWDIDPQALEAPRPVDSLAEVEVIEQGPLRVAICFPGKSVKARSNRRFVFA